MRACWSMSSINKGLLWEQDRPGILAHGSFLVRTVGIRARAADIRLHPPSIPCGSGTAITAAKVFSRDPLDHRGRRILREISIRLWTCHRTHDDINPVEGGFLPAAFISFGSVTAISRSISNPAWFQRLPAPTRSCLTGRPKW